MLAHLEHLDLLSLLVHLNRLHVGLRDYFYGNQTFGPDVLAQLDQAELPLAQYRCQLVKVVNIGISNDAAYILKPFGLLLTREKVKDARLISRQIKLDWVD